MEKNIIGEVKIPILSREVYTEEKWKTGNYTLVDYNDNEIIIVKEGTKNGYHKIDGYYINKTHGNVVGVVLYVGIDNYSQNAYLKKKKEISPRTLLNSYKYIHFKKNYLLENAERNLFVTELSNQETLAGSTFSLEIK